MGATGHNIQIIPLILAAILCLVSVGLGYLAAYSAIWLNNYTFAFLLFGGVVVCIRFVALLVRMSLTGRGEYFIEDSETPETVDINACKACGYSLAGLNSGISKCPECGFDISYRVNVAAKYKI